MKQRVSIILFVFLMNPNLKNKMVLSLSNFVRRKRLFSFKDDGDGQVDSHR